MILFHKQLTKYMNFEHSAATIRQKPYCNILSVQKPVLQYIAIYCLLVQEL